MTEYKLPKITVGSDPELFVRSKKTGKLVSAHDLMPGTKDQPFKIDGGAIQVDGVAAEFNIHPAESGEYFAHYNQMVMNSMGAKIGPDYELVIEPVAVFEKEYWDTLPKKTKELGCNPDFNGWSMAVNPAPDRTGFGTMCTGAGHVHIGWGKGFDVKDQGHFADCALVARQMDYFLGIQSLIWDPDSRRRTLYGKAGCFRPKPYGMEYRTLSNQWLLDKSLMGWVFNQAYNGIVGVFKGNLMEPQFGDMAKRIIDGNITDWTSRAEYSKLRDNVSMPPRIRNKEEVKSMKTGKKKAATSDQYTIGNVSTWQYSVNSIPTSAPQWGLINSDSN